jgi:hypothetical protein
MFEVNRKKFSLVYADILSKESAVPAFYYWPSVLS